MARKHYMKMQQVKDLKDQLKQKEMYDTLNVYVNNSKKAEKNMKNKLKREKERQTEMKDKNFERMHTMNERKMRQTTEFKTKIVELNKENRKKDHIRQELDREKIRSMIARRELNHLR